MQLRYMTISVWTPLATATAPVNVPQLHADIDRTKARQLGVAVTELPDGLVVAGGEHVVDVTPAAEGGQDADVGDDRVVTVVRGDDDCLDGCRIAHVMPPLIEITCPVT